MAELNLKQRIVYVFLGNPCRKASAQSRKICTFTRLFRR